MNSACRESTAARRLPRHSLLPLLVLAGLLATPLMVSGAAKTPDAKEPSEAPAPRHGAVGREGSGPDTLPDGPRIIEEKGQDLRVTPLKGLERPWALTFLPDGAMLVTERPGRLRRVSADFTLDPQPIRGIPEVLNSAYKGLMDVALHPDYADNGWVYFTYSRRLPGETDENWDQLIGPAGTAVLARGRYDGAHALQDVEDLFIANAATSGVSASRIAFGRDGKLYMSIGAPSYDLAHGGTNRVGHVDEAQDPASHAGKILRLNDDGSVPADNPFVDEKGTLPEIYAFGVRNTTGIVVHPSTGEIWEVEHGPNGGDEINIIRAGRNYGWPLVSYGRAYSGERTGAGSGPLQAGPSAPGIEEPLLYWYPNVAPGGLAIYTGDRFPDWRGHAFIGGLQGTQLHRVELTPDGLPREQQSLLLSLGQRIREVREGPDGALYLLTDHDRGALLRVEPAQEAAGPAPAAPDVSQALEPGPSRPELVAIFEATRELQVPDVIAGIPDYTPAAIARSRQTLDRLRQRFDQLDPDGWSQRDQVDYLLTRSELDKLSYGLHVYRPTSRNPNFYLSAFTSFGLASGPTLHQLNRLVREPPPFGDARTQRITEHLQRIPAILEQARGNLTEPNQEMTRLALSTLAEPRQNLKDFAVALAPELPAPRRQGFLAAAADAGEALESYRAWLADGLPDMPNAQPIGGELYDWILKRIWLLPFTGDELLELARQEYGRYLSFTELEEARNRGLPPAVAVATTDDYIAETARDEKRIRAFLKEKDVLTIPDDVGPYRRAEMPPWMTAIPLWAGLSGYALPDNGVAKYAVPEDHPYTLSYWESVMRVDPSTNILHDGIPGHHFQGIVSRSHPSEIRSRRAERFKSEGWCTYWEEAGIQLGYFDDRPRSRELMYNFLRLRALRVIVDVLMARGDMSVEQGTAALMSVPMDRRIAVEEAYDFFVAPTGGIVYQVGKMQIERLLGERRNALGDAFSLRAFHDTLVEAAWVPLELTRWEMLDRGENARAWLLDRSLPPWESN